MALCSPACHLQITYKISLLIPFRYTHPKEPYEVLPLPNFSAPCRSARIRQMPASPRCFATCTTHFQLKQSPYRQMTLQESAAHTCISADSTNGIRDLQPTYTPKTATSKECLTAHLRGFSGMQLEMLEMGRNHASYNAYMSQCLNSDCRSQGLLHWEHLAGQLAFLLRLIWAFRETGRIRSPFSPWHT
jgi:hypothetical protein